MEEPGGIARISFSPGDGGAGLGGAQQLADALRESQNWVLSYDATGKRIRQPQQGLTSIKSPRDGGKA